MSRHAPLPGTSAISDAIRPPVHDSAVAITRPRDDRNPTTLRGIFIFFLSHSGHGPITSVQASAIPVARAGTRSGTRIAPHDGPFTGTPWLFVRFGPPVGGPFFCRGRRSIGASLRRSVQRLLFLLGATTR